MHEQIDHIILHLSLIDKIGPATIEKIVAALSFEQITQLYTASVQEIKQLTGLSENIATRIAHGLADKKLLDTELELIKKHGIAWASIYSNLYPTELKHIYLPPAILYWIGAPISAYTKAISFVGSRQADAYGYAVVNQIIPELIAHNWAIISGGALGIDAMVHQATLQAAGNTAVIFGAGLLKPYPPQNTKLFKQILNNGGSLISSFALNTAPLPGNFPARNRIIAGLSRACIVVQAAAQSGALITAQYALDQGKEIGAIPGPITNPLSAGCHKLIGEGAAIITSAHDVLNLVGTSTQAPEHKQLAINPAYPPQEIQSTHNYTDTQKKILALCQQPTAFDELILKLTIESNILQDELLAMQLDGLITQNYAGLWHAKEHSLR